MYRAPARPESVCRPPAGETVIGSPGFPTPVNARMALLVLRNVLESVPDPPCSQPRPHSQMNVQVSARRLLGKQGIREAAMSDDRSTDPNDIFVSDAEKLELALYAKSALESRDAQVVAVTRPSSMLQIINVKRPDPRYCRASPMRLPARLGEFYHGAHAMPLRFGHQTTKLHGK